MLETWKNSIFLNDRFMICPSLIFGKKDYNTIVTIIIYQHLIIIVTLLFTITNAI